MVDFLPLLAWILSRPLLFIFDGQAVFIAVAFIVPKAIPFCLISTRHGVSHIFLLNQNNINIFFVNGLLAHILHALLALANTTFICIIMNGLRLSCFFFLLFAFPLLSECYDPLDPQGNITIRWDIIQWTGDGYVATVNIRNFQQYRHIQSPGWRLGWTWLKKEIIWSMMGAQAKEQGDCSKFKGTIPHSCMKTPTIIDLLPGVPYNQQVANCCRGGVISSFAQDPSTSVSSFQIVVGQAGTTNTTIRAPRNITLTAPGHGYTCSRATIVKPPSKYLSADGRRYTQVLMTWDIVCQYSQFLTPSPSCCVSLSSFYSDNIIKCPTCACGCKNDITMPESCVEADSPLLKTPGINTPNKDNTPLLRCTDHMCPVRVHWHVKVNYKAYWRVKITVTNFNYKLNYSDWNVVVKHPNFNNITDVFSFNHTSLVPFGKANDTAMFWGIKFFNEMLLQSGELGNVQSEILLAKDTETFTYKQGWAFPRVVYFNGDNCAMPPPDQYPQLPNGAKLSSTTNLLILMLSIISSLMVLFIAL